MSLLLLGTVEIDDTQSRSWKDLLEDLLNIIFPSFNDTLYTFSQIKLGVKNILFFQN